MAVFKDTSGKEWRVYLDAFTIADAKKETGIDLADLSAGGWQAIESDASAVVRVLAVVCAEEIARRKMTGRDFAKQMRGKAIQEGREALAEEAADFFPPSEWSAIRDNLRKRTSQAAQMEAAMVAAKSTELIPLIEAFSKLPASMQERLIASGGDTYSLKFEESGSASGQTVTPSSAVTSSPESAESVPEA